MSSPGFLKIVFLIYKKYEYITTLQVVSHSIIESDGDISPQDTLNLHSAQTSG